MFAVWTNPEHLAQWWGPIGFTTTSSAFNLREGGVWRFVKRGSDRRDYQNRITVDEIRPPQRLRHHHGGADDLEPVQFRTTVTFEDLGRGRTRLTLNAVFPSATERVIKAHRAAQGAEETLSRLAEHLADHLAKLTP